MTTRTPPLFPAPRPLHADGKGLRSDGQEARNRLLDAALLLFAEHGFAKTSIREIARVAQVNVAAISYYFGDKAGLYRGVFEDARTNPGPDMTQMNAQYATLREVLRAVIVGFIEPLKQGDLIKCCMRLHFREMLEPTGLWQDEIHNTILPAHLSLVEVLRRHLGVDAADDELHRLAISITGLGLMVQICTDVTPVLRPALLATPAAIDTYAERMVDYALALVDCEAQRRARLAAPKIKPKTSARASSVKGRK